MQGCHCELLDEGGWDEVVFSLEACNGKDDADRAGMKSGVVLVDEMRTI